jgi:hypothetical protein
VCWSDNLRTALSRIHEEYVILTVDDLFFTAPVQGRFVLAILEWMHKDGANCVHLLGTPRPEHRSTTLVGPLPTGTYYRASAVTSLWRKSTLARILSSGETAWDFEIAGSRRSDAYSGFYSTLQPCFSQVNGIIKGKWNPTAVKALNILGVRLDLSRRSLLDSKGRLAYQFAIYRSRVLKLLPLRMRSRLKTLILRGRYNYRR